MDNIRTRLTRAWGIVLAATMLLAPGLVAQTGSIAGRVLDAQSGQTIPAAQVFISDLDIGVLTQQNGSYILLNVPAGPREVTVQRIGYRQVTQTVTVAAGQTAVLDFRITEEALQLDEIIITGTPGGTQRRAIGNTVSTVNVAEVTQNAAITDFQDLLGGRTPGLQFNTAPGGVGTGSPIRIRGVGSFTLGTQPLIYVDGVRINNDTEAGPTVGEGDVVSVLNDFNPEDIESIEIIKGPAAATLYGTEASAGVIQIITKKGNEGAPEFNLSVRQGINYMSDPAGRMGTFWTCAENPSPGVSGGQYGCDADPNTANLPDLTPYNPVDEANRYIREGYFPWPTENLYQNGLSQSYNLDVRGGTSTVRYFLSANYDNEEGYVWYNTDEAFRLRANVSVIFSDRLSLDVSTGYIDGFTRLNQATVGDGDVWQDMVWGNGYYLNTLGGVTNRMGTTPRPGFPITARLGGFQEHLPYEVASIEATRDFTRFTGSGTLNFNTGELNFGNNQLRITQRAIVGVDKGWDTNTNLFPLETGVVPSFIQDYCTNYGGGASCIPTSGGVPRWNAQYTETVSGEMTYERPVVSAYSFDYAITAALAVADTWNFNTSFGWQYNVTSNDFFSNSGNGFTSNLSRTINQLSQSQITTTYTFTENKSLGYYVQEEIGWRDRLFLTAALRFDDNSTFGEQTPAEKYPKFSGAWVVSEESFWSFDFINSLRLRGAWGKAGRQPSALASQNYYAAVPGPGGAPAIRPQSPGNPGIEPEVSTELEVGFDIALLDDRLSGEFTHWWRKDENVLSGIAVSSSYGFPGSVDTNIGRIENWGWEASLSARIYESEAISFDLDLGADYTMNEIKEIDTSSGFLGTINIREGYSWPNVPIANYVTRAEFGGATTQSCSGINWTNNPQGLDGNGNPCGFTTNTFGQRIVAFCDLGQTEAADPLNPLTKGKFRGGPEVNCGMPGTEDTYLFGGHGFAPHTFSVAPRVSLLNNQLQVFALAEGQYGRTGVDNGHSWGHIYNNSRISRLEDDPYWVAYDRVQNTLSAYDKALFDADFWKLREVGVRYTLPESLVSRTGASRASLAFSARNLWTIWRAQDNIYGHQVTDPEYGDPTALAGDGNFYSAPPLSSVNVTLRVTF